jgi:hypothetical protein
MQLLFKKTLYSIIFLLSSTVLFAQSTSDTLVSETASSFTTGTQHSAYLQYANEGLGLAYDARFRSKISWLDFALTGSVGGTPVKSNFPAESTIQNRSSLYATLSASALFGKKRWLTSKRSFVGEFGIQVINIHLEQDKLSFIDYKTKEKMWLPSVETVNHFGIFGGLRYQRADGGISAFLNTSISYVRYSAAPAYANLESFFRVGLGYSLATFSKS